MVRRTDGLLLSLAPVFCTLLLSFPPARFVCVPTAVSLLSINNIYVLNKRRRYTQLRRRRWYGRCFFGCCCCCCCCMCQITECVERRRGSAMPKKKANKTKQISRSHQNDPWGKSVNLFDRLDLKKVCVRVFFFYFITGTESRSARV